MANTITVTACCNELVIMAYKWGGSLDLCRILSNYGSDVYVKIDLAEGIYTKPVVLHGVNRNISEHLTINLPSGEYDLLLLGIDWSGPQMFDVEVNGRTYISPHSSTGNGLVWYSEPIVITV